MSFDCSITFARNRTSSARSSSESGCPQQDPAPRHPGRGHPPSLIAHPLVQQVLMQIQLKGNLSNTRFLSITRCAASTRTQG